MRAGSWVVGLVATGLAAAAPSEASENRVVNIDTLGTKDVHRLLQSWSLSAIAECLLSEEVDGDTLAHSTQDDFADSIVNCPAARTHQWKKLWRKLESARSDDDDSGGEGQILVEVPPAPHISSSSSSALTQVLSSDLDSDSDRRARRRLADGVLANFGGVHINRNSSMVSFGTNQDVVLYRDGPGSLTVKGNLRQLTSTGDVSLSDIETLAVQVQALSDKLDLVVSNVTTLQSHDYVYTWFEDVCWPNHNHPFEFVWRLGWGSCDCLITCVVVSVNYCRGGSRFQHITTAVHSPTGHTASMALNATQPTEERFFMM